MQWLTENYSWLAPIALVLLANVLNAVLRHYGDASPGLSRALRLVLDILSGLTASDSPGTVKLPGTLSQPPFHVITDREFERAPTDKILPVLLVLLVLLSGCATHWSVAAKKSLDISSATANATWSVAGSELAEVCVAKARRCASTQDKTECEKFKSCRKDLYRLGLMIVGLHESVAIAHELINDAGEAIDTVRQKQIMRAVLELVSKVARRVADIQAIIEELKGNQ